MAARLRRGVVVDGVRYPEGTEETEQLRAAIPNPGAWSGDSAFDVPAATEVGATVTSASAEDVAAAVREVTNTFRAQLKAELLEELTGELRELVDQIPTAILGDSSAGDAADGGGAGDGNNEVPEPPRGGKGSAEDAWRAYAAAIGVDVTSANDRDGIIALVDQHKAASR